MTPGWSPVIRARPPPAHGHTTGRTGGPGRPVHHTMDSAPAGHRNRRKTGRCPPGTRRTADTSPPDIYTKARPIRPRHSLRTPTCQLPSHCTPGTGSSDEPLSGPVTTLRPQPAARRLVLPARAKLALPRPMPPRRRRRRRSSWSARSVTRTNDLEVRQDGGHTRRRGRPEPRIVDQGTAPEGHLTPLEKDPAELLDTKRLSLGAATQSTVSGIADAQNGEIWLLSPTPMISSYFDLKKPAG